MYRTYILPQGQDVLVEPSVHILHIQKETLALHGMHGLVDR